MEKNREIKWEEIKKHNKPDDLWCIISNKVYDLSKFRHEHPGGSDVLEEVAGKNATQEFIDVGHSKDAEEQMKQYYIGDLEYVEKKCIDSKYIAIAVGAMIAGVATVFIIKRVINSSK